MAFQHVDTVVIGGGQAGLAVSWHLTDRQVDHVVLERGQVANRWRTDGWDSLGLLSPNWMSRLPGWTYQGDDPDGYLPVAGLIDYLQGYAESFNAPVLTGTTVLSVRRRDAGYRVDTDAGSWQASTVVVATGTCGAPYIPPAAAGLGRGVYQLSPSGYRNPEQLPAGGVLVVGASATGVQIAQELNRSGRRVVLSAGRHTRLPRSYRGMDIWWWLEQLGLLDRAAEDVADIAVARQEPSAQLVGRPFEDIDLGILAGQGVLVAGRLVGAQGQRAAFAADDLPHCAAAADLRLRRLLDAIDSHVARHGLHAEVLPPTAYRPVAPPGGPRQLELAAEGITSVIWATGYRPSYPWLRVPVLDELGQIRQSGGRTSAPGLYCVGLRFGQRRSSNFLDGVRHDAAAVVARMTSGRCGGELARAALS